MRYITVSYGIIYLSLNQSNRIEIAQGKFIAMLCDTLKKNCFTTILDYVRDQIWTH